MCWSGWQLGGHLAERRTLPLRGGAGRRGSSRMRSARPGPASRILWPRATSSNAFDYLAVSGGFFPDRAGELHRRAGGAGCKLALRTVAGRSLCHRQRSGHRPYPAAGATHQTGGRECEAQTGVDFSMLVPEWQMANYLDDLPGFSRASARDSATRAGTSAQPRRLAGSGLSRWCRTAPAATVTATAAVLRAGSGRHVLVTQAGGAPAVDLLLTAPTGDGRCRATVEPAIGLVRVR